MSPGRSWPEVLGKLSRGGEEMSKRTGGGRPRALAFLSKRLIFTLERISSAGEG